MQKLIKLSDSHYIVVDDSEIKGNDYYWAPIKRSIEQCIKKILVVKDGENDIVQYKITHSTQPLESKFSSILYKGYSHISLSEVEEAIMKDKLFTIGDMKRELEKIILATLSNLGHSIFDLSIEKNRIRYINETIESLLPKKEWDCKVVNGKIELVCQ